MRVFRGWLELAVIVACAYFFGWAGFVVSFLVLWLFNLRMRGINQ